MSRIGRQPIPLPSGVSVTIEPQLVTVRGPKGELSERIPRDITVQQAAVEDGDGQQLRSPGRPIAVPIARFTG